MKSLPPAVSRTGDALWALLPRLGRPGDRRGVQRWDPLSERQRDLLGRIAGGDDLSGPDGVSQRISARGLQSRRLVDVSRKGGVWRAQITDAGTYYLHHGHHPDHPDRVAVTQPPRTRSHPAGTNPQPAAAARTADPGNDGAVATVAQATELIERLHREGGTVRIENPDDATRSLYRRVIHAAKQHSAVPAGYHLLHTGRDSGDIVIRLAEDANPDDTDWNRIRLNTRRVTTDPTIVFAALEKDPANLGVTQESLPRALDLLRALATEASNRGHRLGVNTKSRHPRAYLQIGQARRSITLTEEDDQVRHVPTDKEARELRRNPWHRLPEYDAVPSGRLRLQVARAGGYNHDSWVDDKRTPLERRLRQIIRDVEAGIVADEQAHLAAQKRAEEAAAERRRQEEEQLAQWREAMARARIRAVEKLRQDAFLGRYRAWLAAGEIRAFCAALEKAAAGDDDPNDRENLSRWVAWGTAEADRIDPTRGSASLAKVGFDIDPDSDDLRPFLGKWSPRGPEREYRSERDEKDFAEIRQQTKTWHHGMRGNPNSWRW